MSKRAPRPSRARPDAAAQQLLDGYARARPSAAGEFDANLAWGNADVLVEQWKKQLGQQADAMLLAFRIRRIGMLLDEIANAQYETVGLKRNEMLLLMALHRIGEDKALRPSEILKMHSVTSGTVTYRIDQLTKQDLAERVPDPTDRRGYLIRLTPRGRKMVDVVLAGLVEQYQAKLEPLAQVAGGHDVLEAGLRLFEACVSRKG